MGMRMRVAIVKRTAAMTSEGAPSVCAKRIKSEAVEVVRIAMSRLALSMIEGLKGRMRRAFGSVIRQFYRLSTLKQREMPPHPMNIFLDTLPLQDYNFVVLPQNYYQQLKENKDRKSVV